MTTDRRSICPSSYYKPVIRPTPLLLLIVLLLAQSVTFGQKVSLSRKNIPLQKVLKIVRAQTGYRCFITNADDLLSRPVTVDLKNAPLASFMTACLQSLPLDFYIDGNTIYINLKKAPAAAAPAPAPGRLSDVRVKVTDESGAPLDGISVLVKGTGQGSRTDVNGEIILKVDRTAILTLSGINRETEEVNTDGGSRLTVVMKISPPTLQEVVVEVNDGYRRSPKCDLTGSYALVDSALIVRSVSTNILDRAENVVSGILYNHGGQSADGSSIPDAILIRGRSTINANAAPLLVVDDFPYDGDPGNINPNDVESITILKDAAAAAIWGARAGNGVIVITTKRGKSARTKMEWNSNITVQKRPDVFNEHTIASADYIDLERTLYGTGYYAGDFSNPLSHPPVTPVVYLLNKVDEGAISSADANTEIEAMKGYDVRNDIRKYLYQTSVLQQHAINISGSTPRHQYYFSAGWDHNLQALTGSRYDRITTRSRNTFTIDSNFQVDAGINFTEGIQQNGDNPGYNYRSYHGDKTYYPYAQLADAAGHPLPIYADYNPDYLQQAGQLGFLNWTYSPLADISQEVNKTITRDYMLDAGAHYRIIPSLNLEVLYRFEDELTGQNDLHTDSSYFARDLINYYTQVDPVTNSLSYPIPPGGILDQAGAEIVSHQGRAQLNFTKKWEGSKWGGLQDLTALGGYEIRSVVTTGNTSRTYGYDPTFSSVNTNIDYTTAYTSYMGSLSSLIPTRQSFTKLTDHFMSFYGKAVYTLAQRYIFSASAREDEANLFGVSTNQKGAPLWSAGFAWDLNKEDFYHWKGLHLLKLRATYGCNGNISRLASANTIISNSQGGISGTPYTVATIQSPPNAHLRWEEVRIADVGVDFATEKRVVSGTIDYYRKDASDLMAQAPVDPTLGLTTNPGTVSYFYGNTASMKGEGVDIELESHNLDRRFKWYTNLSFSNAVSKVTRYLLPVTVGNAYLGQNSINPIIGKPLFAVYSYKWMGLDPATGDPQGNYNGKSSKSWDSIYANTRLNNMIYNGPTQPTIFGALRNTFSWHQFSLSVNISYKFGYYFRRPSINYTELLINWNGSSDYAQRWQKPGDEKRTNVPSFADSANRDLFYANSSVLVDKGDQVRLEDMALSYVCNNLKGKNIPFRQIRLYLYAANLALLWKANKDGIDPYYINVPKDGKRFSLGATLYF